MAVTCYIDMWNVKFFNFAREGNILENQYCLWRKVTTRKNYGSNQEIRKYITDALVD